MSPPSAVNPEYPISAREGSKAKRQRFASLVRRFLVLMCTGHWTLIVDP